MNNIEKIREVVDRLEKKVEDSQFTNEQIYMDPD